MALWITRLFPNDAVVLRRDDFRWPLRIKKCAKEIAHSNFGTQVRSILEYY